MRVILAYSGSAAGSAAIAWLREHRGADVVTVTIDLGQGRELEATRDRALALGAVRAHVLDLRERFVQDFVMPALRADAVHASGVPPALALSRPIVAAALADMARIERTTHVAHAGGSHTQASRLGVLLADLAPSLQVTAVQREAATADGMTRDERPANTVTRDNEMHVNLWGRTVVAGKPGWPRRADTSSAESAVQARAAIVDIAFADGIPCALNGVSLPPTELIASLGTLASAHGVGEVSNDTIGCQAPAAVVLHAAHRDLTLAATPADVAHFSATVTAAYVGLIESGRWFSPLKDALDAYVDSVQRAVSGSVRVRLLEGVVTTLAAEPSQSAVRPRAARVVA